MKKKILVIDDDKKFIKLFKLSFGDQFEYAIVNKASEIYSCNHNEIDLILLDLDLDNKKDGFRKGLDRIPDVKGFYREIPIIIVTQDRKPDHEDEALDLGANAWLWKGKYNKKEWVAVFEKYLK